VSAVVHWTPTAQLARVAVTLTAAAAGVGVGSTLAGGAPEPAFPTPARMGLSSGPATLPLPAGWTALGSRSSLPGFEEATAVRGEYGQVAVDIRAPEDASLLPAAAAADGAPQPSVQLIGGRAVWRYDLPGPEPGTGVAALVLPTTEGVVTIACAAGAELIPAATPGCERAMASLRLDGAAPVDAGPAAAAAVALRDTLPVLNRRRRADRSRLAASRSPAARSAAALRLAESHAAAAERLRPLAAGAGRRVAAALTGVARDYRALAAASRRRDAPAARVAGAAIERDERRLARALAGL
jgi:hypothetical protein